ncbi:putative LRAT domain-containing protein [Helianthus anomalus]
MVHRDEIKPGDHIFVWRARFTYTHHGIYVGENKVIHLTSDQAKATSFFGLNLSSSGSFSSSSSNSTGCEFSKPIGGHSCGSGSGSCLCTYYCGYHQPGSGVTISCLNCFIEDCPLSLYLYGESEAMASLVFLRGTCTSAPSDPPQDVINRAICLLKQSNGSGNYNLLSNNCENFALYCKTGRMIPSGQVSQKASLCIVV